MSTIGILGLGSRKDERLSGYPHPLRDNSRESHAKKLKIDGRLAKFFWDVEVPKLMTKINNTTLAPMPMEEGPLTVLMAKFGNKETPIMFSFEGLKSSKCLHPEPQS